MDDLILRFCPPLDQTVVLSIAGDYDLDDEASRIELFSVLEPLKFDAELIEAAADVHDMSIKASSKSALTKSAASESVCDGGQSETDASSIAPFDGLSAAELKSRLRDMFPTCTASEIEHVLEKTTSASDAMDELLNSVFFKESPEIEYEHRQSSTLGSEMDNSRVSGGSRTDSPKGIDGFAVEEDHVPSRKAKARKRKQNKSIRSTWNQSESSLASEGAPNPTASLGSRNAWNQMKEDVDFLSENINMPRSALQHAYHLNTASVPQTILHLVKEQAKERNINDPEEMVDNVAEQLAAIVPELNYSYILSLCQISKESGWSATQLIMLLAEANEESLHFTADPASNLQHQEGQAAKGPMAPSIENSAVLHEGSFDLQEIERQYTFNLYKAADAGSTAHSYWRRGHSDKRLLAAATHYSEERKTAIAKVQQLAAQRAEALAEQQSGVDWVDLHGIKSSDAKRIVTRKLAKYWKDLEASSERDRGPLRGYYRIVTGKGLHSNTGRGVLGPTISKMLVKDGWKISVFGGELAVTGRQ